MKIYDVLKRTRRMETQGEARHTGVDEMLTELYKRVADLEVAVFKAKKGADKPPKNKDGEPQ